MPTAARWGLILALILGTFALFASLVNPLALPPCAMFLFAAAGLWRGWAWCGYGPALWLVGQAASSMAVAPSNLWKSAALSALLSLLIAWALFRAGRALDTGGSKSGAVPWIAVIAANLLVVLVMPAFVVPTGAMENTILIGDRLAVQRFGASHPARGELVTFRYPVDPTQNYVKRVIGLPSDRIHIVNKQAFVNRVALNEPYVIRKTDYIDSYRDNFPGQPNINLDQRGLDMLKNHVVNGEVVVPPDSYFVMGDSRDNSLDSRYWGFVPQANIVGMPRFIYWSEDDTKSSWSWWPKTRWDRTLKALR